MLNLNLPERFELSGPSHDWFVEDDPSDDFCAGRSGQGPGVMVEALKVDALHKRHQVEVRHVHLVSALEDINILVQNQMTHISVNVVHVNLTTFVPYLPFG